jgi:hypothetical protein
MKKLYFIKDKISHQMQQSQLQKQLHENQQENMSFV